jgi:hypothetical protein
LISNGTTPFSSVLIVALLFTTMFVAIEANVSALEYGDLDYQLINGDAEVEITGYHGAGGSINIPNTIDNKPVTSIGDAAFNGENGITSITIASSVTSIGNSAFASCSALLSITFNGNAPTVGTNWIANHNSELTIYFYEGKTGFTTPTWEGVPCVQIGTSTVPGAPTNLVATPGDTQVHLSWTAPSDDGGAAINYYVVYQNNLDVAHVTGTTTTRTSLNNGVNYDFAVAAHNSVGTGAKSATKSATPIATVVAPGAPTALTATSGDRQVQLNWTAPANNGGATIDYYVVYQNNLDVAHVTGTTRTVTNLTNGVSYSFKVAAHNNVGTGANSSTVSAMPATVPGVPTALTAIPGGGQVQLNWTAPANDGGSEVKEYIVYWSLDVNESFTAIPVNGTSYLHEGLESGRTYYYKIAAMNAIGEGVPSIVITTTTVNASSIPSAPTNLQAIAKNGVIELSWSAPISDGSSPITGYLIFRGTATTERSNIANVTGTSYIDSGLVDGRYYYSVAAVNDHGIGASSGLVGATSKTVKSEPGTSINISLGDVAIGATAVAAVAMIAGSYVLRRKKVKP